MVLKVSMGCRLGGLCLYDLLRVLLFGGHVQALGCYSCLQDFQGCLMVQGQGSRESLYTVYAGLQSYYEILSRVYRVWALGLRASA